MGNEERLGLYLHQRQTQTLAPLQMQLVKVLEMNESEVEDYVNEVLDENPALERIDDMNGDEGDYSESAEDLRRADYGNDDDLPPVKLEQHGWARPREIIETSSAMRGETLYEAIMRQFSEMGASSRQMLVGEYVAGNIDNNGYLERRPDEIVDDIAIHAGFEVSEGEVDEAWKRIREMEPAGIGATDLRDSLLIQLKRKEEEESKPESGDKRNEAVSVAREIVEHYFDVFSKMHFEKLSSLMGKSNEQIADAIEEIRDLNPKPGAIFTGTSEADERVNHISPDFTVLVEPSGYVSIMVNNRIPELQIEESFVDDSWTKGSDGGKAAAFIRQKRDEASNFIKVLKMRQQTLMDIMRAIYSLQSEFFKDEDQSKLKPMILKDVERLTGYNLSMISRATSGKYVATQRGIYPLKMFFSERPTEDSDVSQHELLGAIKEIINNEDKRKPLSDAEMQTMLEQKGYGIARRTVAKYREKLGFPVARLRRNLPGK